MCLEFTKSPISGEMFCCLNRCISWLGRFHRNKSNKKGLYSTKKNGQTFTSLPIVSHGLSYASKLALFLRREAISGN